MPVSKQLWPFGSGGAKRLDVRFVLSLGPSNATSLAQACPPLIYKVLAKTNTDTQELTSFAPPQDNLDDMKSESTNGFTRTTYDRDTKLKYTSYYPRGWTEGDLREPVIHAESYEPEPPRVPIRKSGPFYPRPQFPVGDLPPRLPRAPPANAEGTDDTSNQPWFHSLKAYLAKAWMPRYLLGSVDMSMRNEWPIIPGLSRPAGTRMLVDIGRLDESVLSTFFTMWKDQMADVRLTSALAEQGKLVDLTLPDVTHCFMGEDDFRLIEACRFSLPNDIAKLLNAYPLRTVLKVLKLFFNVPEDNEVYNRLRFLNVNHLSPVQHTSLFDLIALPGRTNNDMSLLVVVVPPWDIRLDDLEEFVCVGNRNDDFDLTSNAAPAPSNVLWAVIWDICKARDCRYFVLTNYESWVFGMLSLDMKRAQISTHLPAPIFPADMAVKASDVCSLQLPVPNVFECLLLWLLACTDPNHTAFPLPPDVRPAEPRRKTRRS